MELKRWLMRLLGALMALLLLTLGGIVGWAIYGLWQVLR